MVRPPAHGDERLGEDFAPPIELMPVGKQPWRTFLFCLEDSVVQVDIVFAHGPGVHPLKVDAVMRRLKAADLTSGYTPVERAQSQERARLHLKMDLR